LIVSQFCGRISKMSTESAETEVHEQTTAEKLRQYRIDRYEEIGFTLKESESLADATGHKGFPLNWHSVKKSVDGGCSHRLALKIYT
jgi:hypothetical protein